MIAALILAATVVETAELYSPQLGTFFRLADWMPISVGSTNTFGSCDATNMPRRISDETLSAVNACFEAFYERTYFAYAGQSNVWDESTYGPTCSGPYKREFRFDKGGESRFVYYPYTNRFVNTRRLVEYGNIRYLSRKMVGEFDESIFAIDRPNWWTKDEVFWSSSLFDNLSVRVEGEFQQVPLGTPFQPINSWISPSSFISYFGHGWTGCAPLFVFCGDGGILNWEDPSRQSPDTKYNIPWIAMKEINFGENVFSEEQLEDHVYPKMIFYTTPETVVGTNVEHTFVTTIVRTNVYGISLGMPSYRYQSSTALSSIEVFLDTFGYTNDFSAGVSVPQISMNNDGTGRAVLFVCAGGSPWVPAPEEILIEEMNNIPGRVTRIWNDQNQYYFNMHVEEGETTHADPGVGSAVFDHAYVEWEMEITNVTRFVGVEGLTNDTRRLFPELLGSIGLTLGALDRTYAKITAPMPSVVTQISHFASANYSTEAIVDIDPHYDESEGRWVATAPEITFPTATMVSCFDLDSHAGTKSSPNIYVKYMTNASAGMLFSSTCEASSMYLHYLEQDDIINALENPLAEGGVRFLIEFLGVDDTKRNAEILARVNILPLMGYTPISYYEHKFYVGDPSNTTASVGVGMEVETTYETGRTIGTPTWTHGYRSYPGDFSRASTSKRPALWMPRGVARIRGDKNHTVTDGEYGPEWSDLYDPVFTSMYSIELENYSTSREMFSKFNSCYAVIANKCNDLFNSAIPRVNVERASDVMSYIGDLLLNAGTFSNIRVGNGGLIHFSAKFNLYVGMESASNIVAIEGRIDGGVVEYKFTDLGRVKSEAELPILTGGWSYEIEDYPYVDNDYLPEYDGLYGCSVGGRVCPWAKVDWDWQALKRTKKSND